LRRGIFLRKNERISNCREKLSHTHGHGGVTFGARLRQERGVLSVF
jgi:hypothetical protein